MKTSGVLASAAIIVRLLMASDAIAETVVVEAGVQSVPEPPAEWAVLVLSCEIPDLTSGGTIEVASATLEWPHQGVSETQSLDYEAFVLDEALEGVTTQDLVELLETEPIASGSWRPQDFARIGHARLRLNLRDLAPLLQLEGPHMIQLVVATQDMGQEELADWGEADPSVVVKYGHLGSQENTLRRQ